MQSLRQAVPARFEEKVRYERERERTHERNSGSVRSNFGGDFVPSRYWRALRFVDGHDHAAHASLDR